MIFYFVVDSVFTRLIGIGEVTLCCATFSWWNILVFLPFLMSTKIAASNSNITRPSAMEFGLTEFACVFDVVSKSTFSSCSWSWWTSPRRWFRLPVLLLCMIVSWWLSCIGLLNECVIIVAGFSLLSTLTLGNVIIGLLAMQSAFIVMIPLLCTVIFPRSSPQALVSVISCVVAKIQEFGASRGYHMLVVLIFSGLQIRFRSAWMTARAHWNCSCAGPNVVWFILVLLTSSCTGSAPPRLVRNVDLDDH